MEYMKIGFYRLNLMRVKAQRISLETEEMVFVRFHGVMSISLIDDVYDYLTSVIHLSGHSSTGGIQYYLCGCYLSNIWYYI